MTDRSHAITSARIEAARAALAGAFDAAPAAEGAVAVEPPVLQPAALYFDVSGEDVRGRLLVLDEPGDVRTCLRPDLTIPVTRLHLTRGGGEAVYRYESVVFRADPDGFGPPQESVQLGLERFGDPAADETRIDIAVMDAVWDAVRAGGARPERLMLGDARLFTCFVDGLGLSTPAAERLKRDFARPPAAVDVAPPPAPEGQSQLAAALAALNPTEAEAALREVYRLAGIEEVGARPASAVIERLRAKAERADAAAEDGPSTALARQFAAIQGAPEEALAAVAAQARAAGVDLDDAVQAWTQRLEAMPAEARARAWFSMGFARHFQYYDGMVFELQDPAVGARSTLAAGGRYDGLLARLGGAAPCAAVGAMARPDRVAASALVAEARA